MKTINAPILERPLPTGGNLKHSAEDLAVFGGKPAFAEKLHVGKPNLGGRESFLLPTGTAFNPGDIEIIGSILKIACQMNRPVQKLTAIPQTTAESFTQTAKTMKSRIKPMQNETDLIFKPDMVIKSRDEIKPFLLNSLPKSGTHLMLKLLRKILGENSLDFHLGKERKSILLAGRTVKAVKSPLVWIHRQWWITKR